MEARDIGGKTGGSRAPIGRARKCYRKAFRRLYIVYERVLDTYGASASTGLLAVYRCRICCVDGAGWRIDRLTDSGLSITEWQPISGALPPLNAADWEVAFAKYREIPEYQLVNAGMSLEAFKVIYWWEWGHRQLGRVVGLVFFLPFIVFLLQRKIPKPAWGHF